MKTNYILAILAVSILIAGCATQVTIQSGDNAQDDRRMTTTQGEESTASIEVTPGLILHTGIHTDQNRGLWIINTDGTGLHKVLSDYVDAKWSPDNKLIAYVQTDMWIMNADGSTKAKVGRADLWPIGEFTWSGDGKYIAYEQKGVAVVNVAQKDETQLVTEVGEKISGAAWSDLGMVAFIEGKNIKKINADGKQTEPTLWLELKDPKALKASPNMAMLSFSDSGAFWIAKDEKNTDELTQVSGTVVTNYAWSPDSKRIIYESGGKVHIYDTEAKTEVASFAAHNEDRFTWSKDSQWILFTQKKTGAAENIWIVNAKGAGLKQFTDCPTACDRPDWSH